MVRGSLAKWFPVEDIDCVLTFGESVAILIVRGSWKKLRFCCYVVSATDEQAAENLKAAVLGRVQKRRDHIRKEVSDFRFCLLLFNSYHRISVAALSSAWC